MVDPRLAACIFLLELFHPARDLISICTSVSFGAACSHLNSDEHENAKDRSTCGSLRQLLRRFHHVRGFVWIPLSYLRSYVFDLFDPGLHRTRASMCLRINLNGDRHGGLPGTQLGM